MSCINAYYGLHMSFSRILFIVIIAPWFFIFKVAWELSYFCLLKSVSVYDMSFQSLLMWKVFFKSCLQWRNIDLMHFDFDLLIGAWACELVSCAKTHQLLKGNQISVNRPLLNSAETHTHTFIYHFPAEWTCSFEHLPGGKESEEIIVLLIIKI